MKSTFKLILMVCTVILFGSWTDGSVDAMKIHTVAKSKTANVKAVKKRYDVTISFANNTYYNARIIVSNSSGYYSSLPANPHTVYNALYVPTGTYSVRIEVDAPYDTPYHTYNYNFYVGELHKYGSTAANFENVTINNSISAFVN